MQREDGTETNQEEEIGEIATDFFENLFTSRMNVDGDHILSGINFIISKEDNALLLDRFTMEEIVATLQAMGLTKALGFDGFPMIFFKGFGR